MPDNIRYISIAFVLAVCFTSRGQYKDYNTFLGDTINILDKTGQKQGRWVFFGRNEKGLKNKLLKFNQVVTDGFYVNDVRHGIWKNYHSNTNKLKSEVQYVQGEINGKVKLYNEKGKVTHEGIMKNGEWTGDYFIYNSAGEKIKKRAGEHSNSVLIFSGVVLRNGKPLEFTEITIDRNELPYMKTKSKGDGTFTFTLELQNVYEIAFSKKGLTRTSILVNTCTESIFDNGTYTLSDWKVQMTDNLAASATNELFSFIINKPSNKIYYIKRKKGFGADGSYEHLIKKQLKGISNSTKLLMATTMETNKKLEIENLRIEQEAKLKEIELLQKEQLLQQASLKEKEAELLTRKLEAEKKEIAMALLEQEKKLKELEIQEKENEVLQQQLEAVKKETEIEKLNALANKQKLEAAEKNKLLAEAELKIRRDELQQQLQQRELELANKEKIVKEAELSAKSRSFNVVLAGLGILGALLFVLFRIYMEKKKAHTILEKQKVEIENQKNEIEHKSRIIEEKNEETHQSILYAKRIQHAILPPPEEIDPWLKEYFILYKSKDIVSGDFYFFSDKYAREKKKVIIAAADCTGHGVPGAFMSMIGNEKLKDAVDVSCEPGKIIMELNCGLKAALRQSGESGTRDGMDISILSLPVNYFQQPSISVEYAGANRPLWVIKKGTEEVAEFKATKHAVGGFTADGQEFENHSLQFETGDTLYIFSDGYADQFGGDKAKKMMTKRFKDILVSINQMKMADQKTYLANFFEKWKGNHEQVDDILVIGIRL